MKKNNLNYKIVLLIALLLIVTGIVVITSKDFAVYLSSQSISTKETINIPPIYYSYHISDKKDKAMGLFTDNNNHLLLKGAIIAVKWAKIETSRGVYDWALLDSKISQWTNGNKKKVSLKVSPYGQDSQNKDAEDDNDTTPEWVYDSVPRISFTGGKKEEVSVPKVWDPNFIQIYEEFIMALAKKYNRDKRIEGFIIGIGQNGTLLAQGSRDGGIKFEEAGWILQLWEEHSKKIFELSKKYFRKPVMIVKASAFLNNYNLKDNMEAAKRILSAAALKGISILFRGIDPDRGEFENAFNPELVSYLGTLNPPKSFGLGFGDDWPMWVPKSRSECDKGPTCGRNIEGYEKELQYALEAWDSIDRKYSAFFMFQNPEAIATNPNFPACQPDGDLENCFYKELYDMTLKYLSSSKP